MSHYAVLLQDAMTGEIRTSRLLDAPFESSTSLYWWTQGNMECDCNRYLFFFDDFDLDKEPYPCNNSEEDQRFRLLAIVEPGFTIATKE